SKNSNSLLIIWYPASRYINSVLIVEFENNNFLFLLFLGPAVVTLLTRTSTILQFTMTVVLLSTLLIENYVSRAHAVSRIWTGAASSNWYSSLNWSPVGGPSETDQLSVFEGTISGSQSPVVRDGGSILLSGSNTSVNFPPLWFLNVGETGNGTVTVRNGADLVSFNATFIADEAGSDGDMFVQGTGSTFTTDKIYVGTNGLGMMEITDGGYVTSDEVIVALNPGAANSRALISGTGSTLDVGTGSLSTFAGLGFLDIEDGGTAISGEGRLGVNGGRGEITVTGTDSKWLLSDALDVGRYGAGSLTITNGGLVSTTDLGVHSLTFLGQGTSSITVEGDDSRLDVGMNMNVGQGFGISNTGPGSLTVRNGGTVQAGGTVTLSSQGTVSVEAGGSFYAQVIDRTVGTFSTASGSQVYANQLIGFGNVISIGGSINLGHSGGDGNLPLGAGELLFVNRGLVVGLDNGSEYQVNAFNGGRIDTAIASIGAFPGSVGSVSVQTGSSWSNVDTIQIGLLGDGRLDVFSGSVQTARMRLGQSGGKGTVSMNAGSEVTISDTLSVHNAMSQFRLTGGTLDADTISISQDGRFRFTGGRLSVDTFSGNLTQDGGTLAAGASPGSTEISGDYEINGGSLEVELEGLLPGSGYDTYVVTGDVTLTGGTLDVRLLGDFSLGADQQFDILSIGGSVYGSFVGLGQGALVGSYGGQDLFINYFSGDGNDIALMTEAPSMPGDYDSDGDIDGADFLKWQRDNGAAEGLSDWQENYGNPPVAVQIVPEPTTSALAFATLCLAMLRRHDVPSLCSA
ncbi:MAG: hypothetical protein ACR2NM_06035, partial [Bythopirellula sp.]